MIFAFQLSDQTADRQGIEAWRTVWGWLSVRISVIAALIAAISVLVRRARFIDLVYNFRRPPIEVVKAGGAPPTRKCVAGRRFRWRDSPHWCIQTLVLYCSAASVCARGGELVDGTRIELAADLLGRRPAVAPATPPDTKDAVRFSGRRNCLGLSSFGGSFRGGFVSPPVGHRAGRLVRRREQHVFKAAVDYERALSDPRYRKLALLNQTPKLALRDPAYDRCRLYRHRYRLYRTGTPSFVSKSCARYRHWRYLSSSHTGCGPV
jgi:hypothetical protein